MFRARGDHAGVWGSTVQILLEHVGKRLMAAAAIRDPHRHVLESALVELAGVDDRRETFRSRREGA
jgi:hypothetical protein